MKLLGCCDLFFLKNLGPAAQSPYRNLQGLFLNLSGLLPNFSLPPMCYFPGQKSVHQGATWGSMTAVITALDLYLQIWKCPSCSSEIMSMLKIHCPTLPIWEWDNSASICAYRMWDWSLNSPFVWEAFHDDCLPDFIALRGSRRLLSGIFRWAAERFGVVFVRPARGGFQGNSASQSASFGKPSNWFKVSKAFKYPFPSVNSLTVARQLEHFR